MLEQEKKIKFYTGYPPKEIVSEIDVSMTSITQTNFPYIEKARFTGGFSAVIRGTRIKVSHVIGYLLMGETPETITQNILPNLTPAQIQDAKKYYYYHKEEIEKERRENTEEAGRKYLRESLGEDNYRAITGE
jgi:uncharacterized protein (DUF433 family)